MMTLSRRASLLAQHSAQSSYHAATTIAARTPGLMIGGEDNAREATLMVQEKVAAAYEGAVGASLAWGTFLFASALRGGATPTQFSHALFDVAEAATKPARITVRANARRLSRPGKTR
jgi:hypothetical protein